MKALLIVTALLLLVSCGPKTQILVLKDVDFKTRTMDYNDCGFRVKAAIAGRNVSWNYADGMFYDCMASKGYEVREVPVD